ALQPERSLSHSPLFQVMLVLQNTSPGELELPGLSLSALELEGVAAKFDLTLMLGETAAGLAGAWEYSTDLFERATIRRLGQHFETLLRGIVEDPGRALADIPLLPAAEREQVLVAWNQTQAAYPRKLCMHQLFEGQAHQTPDAMAVVYEDQGLSYGALNARANQLAHHLRGLGVGPEVRVGICVERSLELVVGLLGVLKAGGAYVPLDPSYPQARLAFMLEDAKVRVLLTQAHLTERLPETAAGVLCVDADWPLMAQQSPADPLNLSTPLNLAYVIYTSGSTGTPKGVLVPHKGLLNLVFWHQDAFAVTASDRATQLAGTAFDASVWEIWPYLSKGASLYIVRREILSSSVSLRDWLVSKAITISFVPTPLAETLFLLEWPGATSLRVLLTGGDKLHQYPSPSAPFKLINNYGPTENTVVTTSGLVVLQGQEALAPSLGRPIANTQLYVLDAHLQPVPIGVPGELYIGGAGLARGYLGRPELTAERFIPHAFGQEPGARVYRTGDLVRYLPDGNLEFIGRVDYQVKVRGFRIELGEIEAVLGSHPGVQECCVVVREDHPGESRLVGYYVAGAAVVEPEALRGYLRAKLPDYMVPGVFVGLEALPLTPNGKVDRKALPVPERGGAQGEYEVPRTPTEEL
ncbi:MAG TPA: amino acid adenylation domain-containing protein, partial [Gammaproteobacteria bacterium]|nr:amino acid adenylation domain-containing protein [Gammaproteobacteria bacterium]